MPPSAGPPSLARLLFSALSEFAVTRSASSTRRGRNAFSAGAVNWSITSERKRVHEPQPRLVGHDEQREGDDGQEHVADDEGRLAVPPVDEDARDRADNHPGR